jgi:hypothetical protein
MVTTAELMKPKLPANPTDRDLLVYNWHMHKDDTFTPEDAADLLGIDPDTFKMALFFAEKICVRLVKDPQSITMAELYRLWIQREYLQQLKFQNGHKRGKHR